MNADKELYNSMNNDRLQRVNDYNMNEQRLAEIEEIAHMYDYVLELTQALRAERAKVAELREALGYIQSMECYGQITLTKDCKHKIGHALST